MCAGVCMYVCMSVRMSLSVRGYIDVYMMYACVYLSVYGSSESKQVMGGGVEFVPVEQFEDKGVHTHICEVCKHLSCKTIYVKN